MAEEEKLVAGCLCGKTIPECGDCSGLLGALEAQMGLPRTYPQPLLSDPVDKDAELPAPTPGGGWCAPSEVVYAHEAPDPMFPQVKVRRGGIYYPRYRVGTMVQPAKKRFLRRQMWQLHVRYWDPAAFKYMSHMMVFASEHDANNAEQIIKFTIQTINEQYNEEKRARETAR